MAQLPLHGGKAPAWLFQRMTKLAGAITMAIVDEFGPQEMLARLSDPWWFQAFGCVLGFDWHSSGVTTVTCGAMKEAYRLFGDDLGIHVAGGKGATSRKTPAEIAAAADRRGITVGDRLIYASRMSAKVDSAAVQDGYQLYQHNLFFTHDGQWCVVQQGMNDAEKQARRYHWLGTTVDDFVCEPHAAVSDLREGSSPPVASSQRQMLLNLVAGEAADNRVAAAKLIAEHPDRIMEEWRLATSGPTLFAPRHHRVLDDDINPTRLRKLVIAAHEQHPHDFETLVGCAGVGPATLRSLTLLAEIIFDAPVSHRDPVDSVDAPASDGRRWADYSYAHGGKDRTPFPVDRDTYDRNIHVLLEAVRKARVGENEKFEALRRLRQHDGRADL
jgi:hypothetical protein